jgi:hypothetical protein
MAVSPNPEIRGFGLGNGKIVLIEEKSHNKIYTALNLNELYIKK